eukprot:TRINITY_DN33_c0_g1_i1.p1 TRINITY_DN33_c0_g1~~TRINITY_DN33_c0_g1_i1.p1  ORF type:complete len:133 (+),score=16.83 TRINITY_DN33_c0_g1_i1:402-800(+)
MCRVAGPDQLQAKRQRSLSPRLVLNADLVPTKPPAATSRGLCSPLRRWSKKCKEDEALVDLETLAKEGDCSGSEAATDGSSATTSKSNTPQSSPARRRPSSPKVLLKALMSDDKAQQRARESQRRLLSFLFL